LPGALDQASNELVKDEVICKALDEHMRQAFLRVNRASIACRVRGENRKNRVVLLVKTFIIWESSK
jgi:glutamine synthetase